MAYCSSCGARHPADARFCEECGAKLQIVCCPQCSAASEPDSHFCPDCGSAMLESVSEAITPSSGIRMLASALKLAAGNAELAQQVMVLRRSHWGSSKKLCRMSC